MQIDPNKFAHIKEIISNERVFANREHTFIRHGNPKYKLTGSKNIKHPEYTELSDQMLISIVFSMLITSKRITIYQLCEEIIYCIDKSRLTVLIILLRTLIERVAYYNYFIRQSINYPIGKNESIERLDFLDKELLPKLIRGLYSTGTDIRGISELTDIKSLKLDSYEKLEGDRFDRSTLNILTPIKQLDKKIKGVFTSYALLSEYVHPNFDLELASSDTQYLQNEFGDLLIKRTLKNASSTTRLTDHIIQQIIEIVNEVCLSYSKTIPKIEIYLTDLKSACRSSLHQSIIDAGVKRLNLRKGSKCPCLSGKRIKECIRHFN
jgi:hypothetical protein